jgi:hypothetical protein
VFDKSKRDDGTFSRSDFRYDPTSDAYHCPAGKTIDADDLAVGERLGDLVHSARFSPLVIGRDCSGGLLGQRRITSARATMSPFSPAKVSASLRAATSFQAIHPYRRRRLELMTRRPSEAVDLTYLIMLRPLTRTSSSLALESAKVLGWLWVRVLSGPRLKSARPITVSGYRARIVSFQSIGPLH